jgi:hypothetical protein
MGMQYLSGGALPKNDSEGWHRIEQAAKLDDIRAQQWLCESRPEMTLAESYAWCAVAAINPVEGEGANYLRDRAARARDKKGAGMGPEEISRSQRIAGERHAALEKTRSQSE